ncbi:AAA family ATPase [Albibacterium profundi]|uniref:AAA family ATPase n=1 Tax=Albibacterium profundi TaxID=3134906 RepID=A0ABV5CDH9_9SPHI
MRNNNFYIITGGPGVGKTAVIDELQHVGFLTIREEARRIIKEQLSLGGDGVPWKEAVYTFAKMKETRDIVYFLTFNREARIFGRANHKTDLK